MAYPLAATHPHALSNQQFLLAYRCGYSTPASVAAAIAAVDYCQSSASCGYQTSCKRAPDTLLASFVCGHGMNGAGLGAITFALLCLGSIRHHIVISVCVSVCLAWHGTVLVILQLLTTDLQLTGNGIDYDSPPASLLPCCS
jgi:hypothetical protein